MTALPTSTPSTTDTTPARGSSTFGLILLLGVMAALGAVTIDLYLPSLPEVARDLGVTDASTQLTITCVLVGSALGQLVSGPLSDAYGRRRPALVGFSVYVVACLLCAVAPNLTALVAFRFLSGAGAAAGAVVGMAIIRDLFTGPRAARLMSRLVLVIGVAPLFAPTVGGAIAAHTGWRPVLALLSVAGLLVMLAVWRRLPETRPELAAGRAGAVPAQASRERTAEPAAAVPVARRRGDRVLRAFAGYGALVRDRRFLGLAVVPGLAMSVVMSYVATSPFVFQEGFGLSQGQYALLFAVMGTALVGGSQLNAALVQRFGSPALLRVGVTAAFTLSLVLGAVVLSGVDSLVVFAAPLWLMLLSLGLIMPNAVTMALEPYGASAGSAAALVTALQSGVGGLVGVLTGALGGDAGAMALVVAVATALALTLVTAVAAADRRTQVARA
ncbi:multidrug effflux MFS transporter [Paenibacillus sp. TRM 82003]|uniref:multidrug effflux MFS transporter n=1 Tax=Kineococcus sp. TRM81007 TaxID=2925831 RepID=UPI001F595708|nr:multidrug effflux MFS transporter [Kineococcus sp. TRM81007]MCI2237834.1 multidrug effflux MFS transporter [Kineococcus sp. TRM81007]MCI3926639.1 multidrug effflux MFS transporter [Paenibacillus sp. TRM 82003]